jgi:hypothetical protein
LRQSRAARTLRGVEPPISHSDVTTVMRLLGDIREDVRKIWQLLEDEDAEEEDDA